MGRINVLVVDDSVVIRRLVTTVLEEDPDITVVGTAASGRIAITKLSQVAPDCVTLDMEMPDLDGLGKLLVPAPSELINIHPVTTAVNNVRTDGPELIEPAEPAVSG